MATHYSILSYNPVGQRNLVGFSPQVCRGLDMTEVIQHEQMNWELIRVLISQQESSVATQSNIGFSKTYEDFLKIKKHFLECFPLLYQKIQLLISSCVITTMILLSSLLVFQDSQKSGEWGELIARGMSHFPHRHDPKFIEID